MKKSGCAIIALFLAVCASMFVNLLLLAALVGVKGTANVAAVMLARAIARRRDMGIRLAIGANRFRLLRQLFFENIVLAIVGGAIGVALGRWALKVLVSAADTALPAGTIWTSPNSGSASSSSPASTQ